MFKLTREDKITGPQQEKPRTKWPVRAAQRAHFLAPSEAKTPALDKESTAAAHNFYMRANMNASVLCRHFPSPHLQYLMHGN